MVNQIEVLKSRVQESKEDFEILKQTSEDLLQKEEIKAKLDSITQTKKALDKLKQDTYLSSSKEIQEDFIALEKELSTLEVQFHDKFDKQLNELKEEIQAAEKAEVPEKGRFKTQIDALSDKTEENHWWKNTARIAWGAGIITLWIRWISKWIKKRRARKAAEKAWNNDKEKKDGFWKKALKRAGISVGTSRLTRGLFSGKRDFFGLKFPWGKNKEAEKPGDGDETVPGANVLKKLKEYSKLSDTEKTQFDTLATNINGYYLNASNSDYGVSAIEDQLGDSEFEKKDGKLMMGLVPFILNNRYESVNNILKERSFFYEIVGAQWHLFWDKIKGLWAEKLKKILMPMAGAIEGLTPAFLDFNATGNIDKFIDKLKGNPKSEEYIKSVFRKSMSTIAYLESRKRELEYSTAYHILESKNIDGFNGFSDKKKAKRVLKLLENNEFYTENIEPVIQEFKSKSLYDAIAYLDQKNVLNWDIDTLVQEVMNEIDEEKDDLLDQWSETNDIDEIRDWLENGKLLPEAQEKLQDLCSDFEESIDGFGRRSWYNRYLPILELLNTSDDTLEKIQSSWDYDEIVKWYKDKILVILDKSESGTLRESDLQDLEFQIDDYFKFQKSLATTQINIDEVRQENGDVISRYTSTFVKSGETFVKGIQLTWKWEDRDKMKWGAMVIGAAASLDLISYPIRLLGGLPFGKIASSPTLKGVWKIGKYTIKQWAKVTELLTWRIIRSRLPAGLWSLRYDTSTLNYALCKWEISLENATQIALRKWWHVWAGPNARAIKTVEDMLEYTFPWRTDYGELKNILNKYGNNPDIQKLLLNKGYNNRKIYKWKDWFKADKSKIVFEVNNEWLTQIKKVEGFLSTSSHAGRKSLIEWFMQTTKKIDNSFLEELFATQTFDHLNASEAKNIWRILGKNIKNFASVEEFKSYQTFLASHGDDITDYVTFAKNSAKKRSKVKELSNVDEIKTLNTSLLDRRINAMKSGFKKSAQKMRELAKRSPYAKNLMKEAESMETLSNMDNQVLKTAKMSNQVWTGEWILKMSTNPTLMEKLLPLFEKNEFLNQLKKAKTSTEVKALFKANWVADITDEFAHTLSKTKSIKKLSQTMEYIKRYPKLNQAMKILKNPNMRYISRVFWRVLWAAGFAFWLYAASEKFWEASRLEWINQERSELKKQDAYFELAYAGLGAVELAGMFAGAMGFVPGVGWVIGWAVLWATYFAKEAIFDTLDSYNKNYKDFLQETPILIKQQIIAKGIWDDFDYSSFSEKLTRMFSNNTGLSHLSKKVQGDWVKALLYLEEYEKNPLAMFDPQHNDWDKNYLASLNPPKKAVDVWMAVDAVEEEVAKRYAYLKQKLWTVKGKKKKVSYIPNSYSNSMYPSPSTREVTYVDDGKEYLDVSSILNKEVIKSQWGLNVINKLLLESEYYWEGSDILNTENHKERLKDQLDENKEYFDKLESLWSKDKKTLLYMYRYANDYMAHIQTYNPEEKNKDLIEENMWYLNTYMNYKLLEDGLDIEKESEWFSSEIDFNQMQDFFLDFKLSSPLSAEILYGNTPKINVILYRIANEVVGIKPDDMSLEAIKKVFTENYEKQYGIYFDENDEKRLSINGSWIDTEYNVWDNTAIQKIKQELEIKIKKNDLIDIWTWSKLLNKEIGDKYLNIIDEEIARK